MSAHHPVAPETVITWDTGPTAALTFTVNFAVFAGREPSRLDLERLARRLLVLVDGVSLTAEHRYEFGRQTAADLHQVRVELDPEMLVGIDDVEGLRTRIIAELGEWLSDSLTAVSGQQLTYAERLARDAVVEGVLDEGPSAD